ncbi:unnamed protein product [Rotaria sp. Silwood1]|nr:unnamed protein product [Rotaria sp. Silwood1]CAF5057274.1 unnamed protein product [Rotaria sp. Silwood1]
MVNGRTRLWRSISPTTFTYTCRWRTFLTFEDILIHSKNDFKSHRKLHDRVDNVAILCAILYYDARLEALLLPNEINSTVEINNIVYYEDWWPFVRHRVY